MRPATGWMAYFTVMPFSVSLAASSLADESLVEAVTMLDRQPARGIARCLPYTTKSVLPQWPWLVKLYLRLPLAW